MPVLAVVALAVLLLVRAPGASLVVVLALPVAGLLHALFIVKSGGDYLHARLLLPSVFALLAPFASVWWTRKLLVPVVVLGVWAVVAVAFLRPSIQQGFVPLTEQNVAEGRDLMSSLTLPGRRPILAEDFIFVDGPLAKRLQERGRRALVTATAKRPILDATPARTTLVIRWVVTSRRMPTAVPGTASARDTRGCSR